MKKDDRIHSSTAFLLFKMTNFLFLLSIAILFAGEVRGLQIENICQQDIFHYNDIYVNAIHRIRQVIHLPELAYFLIPESEDFYYLLDYSEGREPNPSLRNEALRIKSDYNSKVQEIYSERYVNGPNFEKAIRSESAFFDGIAKRLQQVRQRLNRTQDFFDERMKVTRNGQQLVDYLLPFLDNQLQPLRPIGYVGLQPDEEKMYVALEKTLKRLDLDDYQTLAFRDDFMTDIYEMPIVTRPKLEFSKPSRTFLDPKVSGGRLRFDIVLPIFSRAYGREPCTRIATLPKFFSERKA